MIILIKQIIIIWIFHRCYLSIMIESIFTLIFHFDFSNIRYYDHLSRSASSSWTSWRCTTSRTVTPAAWNCTCKNVCIIHFRVLHICLDSLICIFTFQHSFFFFKIYLIISCLLIFINPVSFIFWMICQISSITVLKDNFISDLIQLFMETIIPSFS